MTINSQSMIVTNAESAVGFMTPNDRVVNVTVKSIVLGGVEDATGISMGPQVWP